MIKELYRLRLVMFLAFVAVLMGLTRWKYRDYQWQEPQVVVQITPTEIPTPIPSQLAQMEVIYPMIGLLPYEGKGFTVDSYSAPLTLNVVTSGNIKTITKEVYKWMEENKVATESHKLIFVTSN